MAQPRPPTARILLFDEPEAEDRVTRKQELHRLRTTIESLQTHLASLETNLEYAKDEAENLETCCQNLAKIIKNMERQKREDIAAIKLDHEIQNDENIQLHHENIRLRKRIYELEQVIEEYPISNKKPSTG